MRNDTITVIDIIKKLTLEQFVQYQKDLVVFGQCIFIPLDDGSFKIISPFDPVEENEIVVRTD